LPRLANEAENSFRLIGDAFAKLLFFYFHFSNKVGLCMVQYAVSFGQERDLMKNEPQSVKKNSVDRYDIAAWILVAAGLFIVLKLKLLSA
jgi:hypothetical protein